MSAPFGRGFHEKATAVNYFFVQRGRKLLRRPTGGASDVLPSSSSKKGFCPFPPTAESPGFHSHSVWSWFAPVPVGVLDSNGCCHLGAELKRLCFQKRLVPPRPRSHPNSAILLDKPQSWFRPPRKAVAWPDCCATVRRLPRSSIACVIRWPASAPPPRWRASWRSCRRVRPASDPSV